MSLSTPISFITLPPSIERPPLHDGRSTPTELIKLVNQQRATLNGSYETTFDFSTPGDAAFHNAWGAQLADGDVWATTVDAVATSPTGGGGGSIWIRRSLILRSGAAIFIFSDVNIAHATSAGATVNFDMKWVTSSLYAYLQLADDVATDGAWRVGLKITKVSKS